MHFFSSVSVFPLLILLFSFSSTLTIFCSPILETPWLFECTLCSQFSVCILLLSKFGGPLATSAIKSSNWMRSFLSSSVMQFKTSWKLNTLLTGWLIDSYPDFNRWTRCLLGIAYHCVVRQWPQAILHRVEDKNSIITLNKKVGLTVIEKWELEDPVHNIIYNLCEALHAVVTVIASFHPPDEQLRALNSEVKSMGRKAARAIQAAK